MIVGLGVLGMVLWGWLVVEVLQERLTLIIDFEATRNPLYRAWRLAAARPAQRDVAHARSC